MPEGDTVWRTANSLRAGLVEQTLTRCDIRVPRFATLDLTGQQVDAVVSRGKHLFIRAGTWSIHSHLAMEGAWHLYSPGTRWRRPTFEARIVLGTARSEAVGFALGLLEVLPAGEEEHAVAYLGPDVLGPDWDAAVVLANLEARPERPIGLALLDQRVLAGVGNEYRNEICFLRGLHPRRPVGTVPTLSAVINLAYRSLQVNKDRVRRSTTGDLRRGRNAWVYGRDGAPCRRCGTTIVRGELGEDELHLRVIYFCPYCQT